MEEDVTDLGLCTTTTQKCVIQQEPSCSPNEDSRFNNPTQARNIDVTVYCKETATKCKLLYWSNYWMKITDSCSSFSICQLHFSSTSKTKVFPKWTKTSLTISQTPQLFERLNSPCISCSSLIAWLPLSPSFQVYKLLSPLLVLGQPLMWCHLIFWRHGGPQDLLHALSLWFLQNLTCCSFLVCLVLLDCCQVLSSPSNIYPFSNRRQANAILKQSISVKGISLPPWGAWTNRLKIFY